MEKAEPSTPAGRPLKGAVVNFNLVLAAVWLLLAGYCFFMRPEWTFGGSGLSVGWLGVVMAVYNVARWWSFRSYSRQRRELLDERRGQELPARQPPQEPDPTFDFGEPSRTEEPPR